MKRKYPLDEMDEDSFEALSVSICERILGAGVIPFSKGRDGGRDGRFEGTANCFPSLSSPWAGKFIIQAKHTTNPVASCSDSDFSGNSGQLIKELPKIQRLKQNREVDYYLVFTNRRLTGQKDEELRAKIFSDTSTKSHIFGIDQISAFLVTYPDLIKQYQLNNLLLPFTFYEKDIQELVVQFPKRENLVQILEKTNKFELLSVERKNEINQLSAEYFQSVFTDSVKSFEKIESFLQDPRNDVFKEMYLGTVQDIQEQVILHRETYSSFDQIFWALYSFIFDHKNNELAQNRRLIRVFLHYMYFTCDIGRRV